MFNLFTRAKDVAEQVEAAVAIRYRQPVVLIDALVAELTALEAHGLTMTSDRIRSSIGNIRAGLLAASPATKPDHISNGAKPARSVSDISA